jgi:hypothetical protein
MTGTGSANTLNGESGLTYDGSTLAVTGAVTSAGLTLSGEGLAYFALGTYSSSAANNAGLRIRSSSGAASGNWSGMTFQATSGDSTGTYWQQGITTGSGSYASDFVIKASTGASSTAERLRITSGGKIQIGNNIPMWSGSYGGALFLKGNNATSDRYAQLTIVDSTGTLAYNGLIVNSSGNVGIGTTSPTVNLDVYNNSGWGGLDIDGTSGGEIRLQKAGTRYGGIYASDSTGLVILAENGANSTLFYTNGSERMRIDSAGIVTQPYQPAFSVRPTSTQSNIAVGSFTTVNLGTEIFDVGSNFAGNTFTAPVTGKYQLNFSIRLQAVDTASAYYQIRFNTSNRLYYSTFDFGGLSTDPSYWSPAFSILADMDANDTVYMSVSQATGTQQTDIHSETYFTGYLVA